MAWLQLKGEQLSGSAYYFNGCKALMFSSVVHFNQAIQQLSTWVKPTLIYRGLKTTEVGPVAVSNLVLGPSAAIPEVSRTRRLRRTRLPPKKKKKNSAVNWICLWRGNPRPGQEKKKKKKKEKSLQVAKFSRSEGEKRQMFNFLQWGWEVWICGGGGGGFSCLHSVKVFVFVLKNIFDSYFFSNRGERN